jgi:hypothetical protein
LFNSGDGVGFFPGSNGSPVVSSRNLRTQRVSALVYA